MVMRSIRSSPARTVLWSRSAYAQGHWAAVSRRSRRAYRRSKASFRGHVRFRSVPSRSAVSAALVLPQEIGSEIAEAGAADLAHHEIDLVDKNVDRLLHPRQAIGCRAVKRRPAEEAEIGAEGEGDQDVGAASDAAVQKQGQLVAYRGADCRQHVQGAGCPVELPSAMVRHENAVAAGV